MEVLVRGRVRVRVRVTVRVGVKIKVRVRAKITVRVRVRVAGGVKLSTRSHLVARREVVEGHESIGANVAAVSEEDRDHHDPLPAVLYLTAAADPRRGEQQHLVRVGVGLGLRLG